MGMDLCLDYGFLVKYGFFNFTFLRNEAQLGGAIFVDQKSSAVSGQNRITARMRSRAGINVRLLRYSGVLSHSQGVKI